VFIGLPGRFREWDQVVQSLMISLMMIVFHVLLNCSTKWLFAKKNIMIKTLRLDRFHKAFGIATTN